MDEFLITAIRACKNIVELRALQNDIDKEGRAGEIHDFKKVKNAYLVKKEALYLKGLAQEQEAYRKKVLREKQIMKQKVYSR